MTLRRRSAPDTLHLRPQQLRNHQGSVESAVQLESRNFRSRTLWFRVPASCSGSLAPSLDPFVIAALFVAMRSGSNLHAHGSVSPSLLHNLQAFQAKWHEWLPSRYQPARIAADHLHENVPAPGDHAALTFSGGLDSCHTAWRHTLGPASQRRYALQTAIMAHGFDIPLAEPDTFARAAENSRLLAASTSLEFIPVATNYRQCVPDWELTHGAALAACLHLVRRRFSIGLIAASHTHATLRLPWGSNPITDPLLSSASLTIVHDGCDATRPQKARAIATWPEAMNRLRVCWEGPHKDRNCGHCLRCVATAICFAVEKQPIPACLHIHSLDAAIRNLKPASIKPVSTQRLAELLETAQVNGIQEAWVEFLATCCALARHHHQTPTPNRVAARIRQAFHRVLRARPPSNAPTS